MVQLSPPPGNSTEWTEFLGPSIAAIVALVAVIRLWLNRRDKKSRLTLDIHKAYIPTSAKGPSGGNIVHPAPGFTIYAYNPSDKDIKIHATRFVDAKGQSFQVARKLLSRLEAANRNRTD